jgi:hypothetical protein
MPAQGSLSSGKPWASNAERLVDLALASADLTYEQIESIRPPLPQVQLFPPRFGYRPYVDQFRIEDVVDLDLLYPGSRVDFSGSTSGYQGSSFPALNQM